MSLIGRTISHYRVEELIGKGGMGEVYRALDTKLGRQVALKILPDSFAGDPQRLARFSREAKILASLNHPNIASIYGLEESSQPPALVLELVEGETLKDFIAKDPLPLEQSLRIALEITRALEAAHDRGVVHRDLKPDNIKITPEGTVKVLDFGLAKALEKDEDAGSDATREVSLARTEAGMILGTPSYMSPEQARGGETGTGSDIWAFGCCFYELLTGEKTFSGETVSDTIGAILRDDPDWERLPPDLPMTMETLLRRCLRKEARTRQRDVGDAGLQIEEALAGSEKRVGVHRASPKRRAAWGWGLGVAILAFLVGSWFGGRGETQPLEEPITTRFVLSLPTEIVMETPADIAVSSDGSQLAYVGGRPVGGSQIYLRRMDQLNAQPIPGTRDAVSPFFSPDGRWLAYFSAGALRKRSLTGGGSSEICRLPIPDRPSAHWGINDTIVFSQGLNTGLGLFKVSANGGTPETLTRPAAAEGESVHSFPQLLPDGDTVIFTASTGEGLRIAVLKLSTGETKILAELGEAAGGRCLGGDTLVYGRGGSLLAVSFDPVRAEVLSEEVPVLDEVFTSVIRLPYFSLTDNGSLFYVAGGVADGTIVLVDRDGNASPLAGDSEAFQHPKFSPDGTRIAVDILSPTGNRDVWVYDVERNTRSRLTSEFGNLNPVWHPDGEHLTFRSNRRDGADIFLGRADGTGSAELLLGGVGNQVPNSWSPDGRLLLFNSLNLGGIRILDAESREVEIFDDSTEVRFPFFSPDGGFFTYVSNESGRPEVYVRAYPGPEGKWSISTDGGAEPVWSSSGREIFYRRGDELLVVTVGTQAEFSPSPPQVLFSGRFDVSGNGHQHYDVSPDGETFAMIRLGEGVPQVRLNVILNWKPEVERFLSRD